MLRRVVLGLCFVLFPTAVFADSFTYNYSATPFVANTCSPTPCPPAGFDIPLGGSFPLAFGYTPGDGAYLTFTIDGQTYFNPAFMFFELIGNVAQVGIVSGLSEIPAKAGIFFIMPADLAGTCGPSFCSPPLDGFHFDQFNEFLSFQIRDPGDPFIIDFPVLPPENPAYYLDAFANRVVPVPEPSSWLLLTSGIVGVCLLRRKRVR
jgi:hypothetical protein